MDTGAGADFARGTARKIVTGKWFDHVTLARTETFVAVVFVVVTIGVGRGGHFSRGGSVSAPGAARIGVGEHEPDCGHEPENKKSDSAAADAISVAAGAPAHSDGRAEIAGDAALLAVGADELADQSSRGPQIEMEKKAVRADARADKEQEKAHREREEEAKCKEQAD